MWQQRPSELLGISDPYVAFCLDEAGAELLSHKEPPTYPEDAKDKDAKNPLNNPKLLAALQAAGGVKIHGQIKGDAAK